MHIRLWLAVAALTYSVASHAQDRPAVVQDGAIKPASAVPQ